jgi:hypothetical protein
LFGVALAQGDAWFELWDGLATLCAELQPACDDLRELKKVAREETSIQKRESKAQKQKETYKDTRFAKRFQAAGEAAWWAKLGSSLMSWHEARATTRFMAVQDGLEATPQALAAPVVFKLAGCWVEDVLKFYERDMQRIANTLHAKLAMKEQAGKRGYHGYVDTCAPSIEDVDDQLKPDGLGAFSNPWVLSSRPWTMRSKVDAQPLPGMPQFVQGHEASDVVLAVVLELAVAMEGADLTSGDQLTEKAEKCWTGGSFAEEQSGMMFARVSSGEALYVPPGHVCVVVGAAEPLTTVRIYPWLCSPLWLATPAAVRQVVRAALLLQLTKVADKRPWKNLQKDLVGWMAQGEQTSK